MIAQRRDVLLGAIGLAGAMGAAAMGRFSGSNAGSTAESASGSAQESAQGLAEGMARALGIGLDRSGRSSAPSPQAIAATPATPAPQSTPSAPSTQSALALAPDHFGPQDDQDDQDDHANSTHQSPQGRERQWRKSCQSERDGRNLHNGLDVRAVKVGQGGLERARLVERGDRTQPLEGPDRQGAYVEPSARELEEEFLQVGRAPDMSRALGRNDPVITRQPSDLHGGSANLAHPWPTGLARPPSAYVATALRWGVPAWVLFGVALQESHLLFAHQSLPYPWTLDVRGRGLRFASYRDALEALTHYLLRGITNIDCGAMQVNWRAFGYWLSSPAKALNPYHNLAVGAQILASHFAATLSWPRAVALYHTGSLGSSHRRGSALSYVEGVSRQLSHHGLTLAQACAANPRPRALALWPDGSPAPAGALARRSAHAAHAAHAAPRRAGGPSAAPGRLHNASGERP